ncbi:MAG: protein TolQ [Gammaproteobacteria bacterium RIFCSPHIGHO2_12_FULL_37_14]|nr:MAG: protein TolQ [Gammaproteobacteria bacterium RIFCSPHIGHO2_12_FULL_37_14]
MNYDATLLTYFLQAGLLVKGVMLLLIGASVVSWAYILQRGFYLNDLNKASTKFETNFWSGEDLAKLYAQGVKRQGTMDGIEAIFHSGFKEFMRFRRQTGIALDTIIDNTKRAMRVAQMREQDKLEQRLPFLAIVGSTSPYVGLFGTVWGIMQAFRALANVQQASISMVAPGIAEALIATALGLFAAIPAVIAYNRFTTSTNRLLNRYDAFQEELINILIRQSQPNSLARETTESQL